jgi:hypothetical protein
MAQDAIKARRAQDAVNMEQLGEPPILSRMALDAIKARRAEDAAYKEQHGELPSSRMAQDAIKARVAQGADKAEQKKMFFPLPVRHSLGASGLQREDATSNAGTRGSSHMESVATGLENTSDNGRRTQDLGGGFTCEDAMVQQVLASGCSGCVGLGFVPDCAFCANFEIMDEMGNSFTIDTTICEFAPCDVLSTMVGACRACFPCDSPESCSCLGEGIPCAGVMFCIEAEHAYYYETRLPAVAAYEAPGGGYDQLVAQCEARSAVRAGAALGVPI